MAANESVGAVACVIEDAADAGADAVGAGAAGVVVVGDDDVALRHATMSDAASVAINRTDGVCRLAVGRRVRDAVFRV
jgi:hypothetical protein